MKSYVKKYNKYVKKISLLGGNVIPQLNSLTDELNSLFTFDSWCYTGSIAICLYCQYFKINCPYTPNDFDVIFVPESCQNIKPYKIGNLSKKGIEDTNNGLKYYNEKNEKVLDLICAQQITYSTISIKDKNYNLIDIATLLKLYEELYLELSEDTKNVIIQNQINTTQNKIDIIKKIMSYDKLTTHTYKKTSYTEDMTPIPIRDDITPIPFNFGDDD